MYPDALRAEMRVASTRARVVLLLLIEWALVRPRINFSGGRSEIARLQISAGEIGACKQAGGGGGGD